MRIAVFLDNINFENINKDIREVFLFEIQENLVVAVGEATLSIKNDDYVIVWLLGKKVERIYIDRGGELFKEKVRAAGMALLPIADMRDFPILKALLAKDK